MNKMGKITLNIIKWSTILLIVAGVIIYYVLNSSFYEDAYSGMKFDPKVWKEVEYLDDDPKEPQFNKYKIFYPVNTLDRCHMMDDLKRHNFRWFMPKKDIIKLLGPYERYIYYTGKLSSTKKCLSYKLGQCSSPQGSKEFLLFCPTFFGKYQYMIIKDYKNMKTKHVSKIEFERLKQYE